MHLYQVTPLIQIAVEKLCCPWLQYELR
jgi:hypothetical protein